MLNNVTVETGLGVGLPHHKVFKRYTPRLEVDTKRIHNRNEPLAFLGTEGIGEVATLLTRRKNGRRKPRTWHGVGGGGW